MAKPSRRSAHMTCFTSDSACRSNAPRPWRTYPVARDAPACTHTHTLEPVDCSVGPGSARRSASNDHLRGQTPCAVPSSIARPTRDISLVSMPEHLAKTTQSMATMLAKPPVQPSDSSNSADVRDPDSCTAVSLKPPSFQRGTCTKLCTDPSPSRCAFDPDGQQLHIATGTAGVAASQVLASVQVRLKSLRCS